MPVPATVQLTAGSLPIASSFADISTHPPTINELTTDLIAKPGNIGVVKGLVFLCFCLVIARLRIQTVVATT